MSKMKKMLFLICLTGFFANAQEGSLSLSLQQATDYALENSYEVLDKEIEYEKAGKIIAETRALGLPQVSFGMDYQWNPQLAKQPVPAEFFGGEPGTFAFIAFGVEHQNTANLTVNQLIFDASYLVALRASKVVRENAELNREKVKIDVKANTAKAYYAVLISDENVKVIDENLKSLQKNLFEVQKLYENGFTEEQDVDQLELLVNTLQNNLNNSKRQKEISNILLKYYLGLDQTREIVLTDDLEDILVVEDPIGLRENKGFNYEQHIDYRSLLAQEKGAQLQVTYDKMAFIPKLTGFVRHSESNFSETFSGAFNFDTYWIPATAVGVGLRWDLFNGGGRFATVQKSKLDLDRIEVAKSLTENALRLSYEQSLSNYEFALENYNSQVRNVEISRKIRDKTRIKYKEGISSSLDLTQAENQYLESQSLYIQALLNLLNTKEELQKALGK